MIAVIVLAAICITNLVLNQRSVVQVASAHAAQVAEKDAIILGLISQVQANAQNMPYYPTLGPAPEPLPEAKMLTDPSGLIQFEDYEDDALEEVAR